MKKSRQFTQKKRIMLIGFGILVVIIILAVALGGINKVRQIYYGHITREAYSKEYKNLQSALEHLGLIEDKNIKSTCNIDEVATDGFNTEKVLLCGVNTQSHVVITEPNKEEVKNAAKELDELVAKNNGRLQTNIDTTFSKYVTDISNGIDYHPDFGAVFVRDDYLCAISFNVAYANPSPPAYLVQFGCNSPRVSQDDTYLLPAAKSSL